ncbi:hypothetical protein HCN44_010154 [Aphidius gifuensis]|uniref:Uncharacterized protein n=1 Tax=Aphidius gifuensis TaxID=684658 RepID=A0A835CS53_APHGI|nr:hypothetical protein HCN44_010154 [Aphidius gifuensis]
MPEQNKHGTKADNAANSTTNPVSNKRISQIQNAMTSLLNSSLMKANNPATEQPSTQLCNITLISSRPIVSEIRALVVD